MLKKFVIVSIIIFVFFSLFIASLSMYQPYMIVQAEYTKTSYYYLENKINTEAEEDHNKMVVDSRYYSMWKQDKNGNISFVSTNCEDHTHEDTAKNTIAYINENKESFPCTLDAFDVDDFYDFNKEGFLCGEIDGTIFVAKEMNGITYYAFEHMSHMPNNIWGLSVSSKYFIISALIIIAAAVSWSIFTAWPLKKAMQKQEQFLSDASHELKLPLSVISLNNGIVKRDTRNLTKAQKELLLNNIEQTEKMKALIDSMMSAIRKASPKNTLSLMDISASDIILESALNFETMAYELGKTIISDIDKAVFVSADSLRLRQIANILIDNACKYSQAGSEIIISLKKHSGKAHFSVTSYGKLLSNEDKKKIFDRFYRGDTSRHEKGHGLGLNIAKNNAEAMKMKLFVADEGNCGTQFTLVMNVIKNRK